MKFRNVLLTSVSTLLVGSIVLAVTVDFDADEAKSFLCGGQTQENLGFAEDRSSAVEILLDDNASSSIGTKAILVTPYRNLVLQIQATSSPTMTIKFRGSISETAPDFDNSTSSVLKYDNLEIVDLQNSARYDGDTGVAFTGTNEARLFEVNTNGLTWLYATTTAYTAGSTTVQFKPFTNQ